MDLCCIWCILLSQGSPVKAFVCAMLPAWVLSLATEKGDFESWCECLARQIAQADPSPSKRLLGSELEWLLDLLGLTYKHKFWCNGDRLMKETGGAEQKGLSAKMAGRASSLPHLRILDHLQPAAGVLARLRRGLMGRVKPLMALGLSLLGFPTRR